MRERLRRLLPLLLLIVYTFCVVVRAQQRDTVYSEDVVHPAGEHAKGRPQGDGQRVLQAALHQKSDGSGGDGRGILDRVTDHSIAEQLDKDPLAVNEALSILRSLKPSKKQLVRFDKPSGFVGTTLYYAKEAFYLLFLNGPSEQDDLDLEHERRTLSKPLAKAVQLLEEAARRNDSDALFLLAEMNLYGNYTHPRNFRESFRRYHELSSRTGNGSAQHMVGFMYSTGIGGAVERDQAKALLYQTFAARSGNVRSEMAVAFRHHSGIGTPRNCNAAVVYYKRVADKAIDYLHSGPPGGMALQRDAYRLADEDGGVYGEGASVTSAGVNANKAGLNSDSHASLDDVLEYLDLMSRKGDPKATFSLGRLHYEGSRALHQNFRKAKAYFMIVAKKYWARDGRIIAGGPAGVEKVASKCAGYLGRMFLRGEGTEQSFEKALTWFRRGLANGDALCQYELGLMYLKGYGVPQDALKATDYFKAAADQDFASAQVNLGKLFLDQGDVQTAIRYFELSARHGHIEAFYYLAELSNQGVGRDRSCGIATAYYKIVAEKAEAIHISFAEANQAYESGDLETALIDFMLAAEQGYENGQANVAYMLDEHKSILSLGSLLSWTKRRSSLLRNATLALIYWTRSAKQSNVDSMVKMGDYYLGGWGTSPDKEKAAMRYQTAAEFQQSAQALWNLGWMHENGIGVDQDFHLAKRFYDQALETNQEAYLPVKLSLLKLRVRSLWNTFTNGHVNSIQSEPELKQDWSLREWIANFLRDDHPYYHDVEEDDFTDPIAPDPMPGGDDYYDAIDEGLVESFIILGLAAALIYLVYYRQQRTLNHRRAMEQQGGQGVAAPLAQPLPGQQADGGFFPPPGDPNFNQWVAGGIGH